MGAAMKKNWYVQFILYTFFKLQYDIRNKKKVFQYVINNYKAKTIKVRKG